MLRGRMVGMKRQFSLRDLLWLTALVAVAIGWWMDHAELSFNFRAERNQHDALHRDYMSLRASMQMLEEDLKALEDAKTTDPK